jgi:sigma-B regulation protein RsbU (phosphoserine phosphatase)
MELVAAEEASVLLLDDEKENFRIYHVEGVAKPALEGATFPTDVGLAGSVLQSQRAEVINDVQSDPRFYRKMDSEFGYPTRNMIALPLVAGEEPVGVLEVINKAGGASFTEDESLLLLSISEEIAFAIRNAKVFEYVVNSYCKQRQGQPSCKGCDRPLGSWTPCVKYREVSI